jgi:hypothetical protein
MAGNNDRRLAGRTGAVAVVAGGRLLASIEVSAGMRLAELSILGLALRERAPFRAVAHGGYVRGRGAVGRVRFIGSCGVCGLVLLPAERKTTTRGR